jgi:hypothetical protein
VSIRSPLVPLAAILLSFGQLIWNGWNATSILAENLPNPRGQDAVRRIRIVDLVHQTPNLGRIYDFRFERPAIGSNAVSEDARVKVQLSSNGRTRILIIRTGSPTPLRRSALLDLLRGKARLEIVADGKWVDLGLLPRDGQPLRVQVAGLLPGSFGFAELNRPVDPFFSTIRITRRQRPEASAVGTVPRYRVTVRAPVTARETLARFFFFISLSRVLQVAGAVALVLLFAGWWFLGTGRVTGAISCLIPSVVLLHAVCLPPLQGADETSHEATIERLVLPSQRLKWFEYPESVERAADVLQQDRVQFHPDEPLPLRNETERNDIRRVFEAGLRDEARQSAPPPVAAFVQPIDMRAPLFYRSWKLIAPLLRGRSLIDRLSLYGLLSACSGLVLFCAGTLLLQRAAISPGVILAYGVVWLVPYMVFVVASTSNYATAIGLGSLLAACVLVIVLSEEVRPKQIAVAILLFGSWAGIRLWPDFIFLAPLATVSVLLWLVAASTARFAPLPRRLARGAAGFTVLVAFAFLGLRLPGPNVLNIGRQVPRALPAVDDPVAATIAVVVGLPLLLGTLAAWALLRLGDLPDTVRRIWLRRASWAMAALFILAFLLTPYTIVPYLNARLPYGNLVLAHLQSFLSSAFSWDQDTLSWKLYVGAAGWHDVFYPGWFYAVAKWALVVFLICLPAWLSRTDEFRPRSMATLLLLAGFGASLSVATLTLRYFQPGNPWGRFMLPWLPLVATPLLVPFAFDRKSAIVRTAVRVGVLIQIWTAVFLLGTRYLFGQG